MPFRVIDSNNASETLFEGNTITELIDFIDKRVTPEKPWEVKEIMITGAPRKWKE